MLFHKIWPILIKEVVKMQKYLNKSLKSKNRKICKKNKINFYQFSEFWIKL